MTPSQLQELNWDWEFWARPNQLIPKGDWLTWLLLAGRGFGKTRSAAEAVRALVCGATPLTAGKHARIALVAETAADARDVMVEGESGLLAVHPQEFRPLYEPSKRRLTWPNGALATLYNAVEPDQLRGPQHSLAWCDELAKWRYAQETWDMLQFGLRLGARPQAIIATTPRPIPVLKQIIRQPGTVITRGTTFENRSNLAESFLSQVVSRYEGTRLGRQELSSEILDDIPRIQQRGCHRASPFSMGARKGPAQLGRGRGGKFRPGQGDRTRHKRRRDTCPLGLPWEFDPRMKLNTG